MKRDCFETMLRHNLTLLGKVGEYQRVKSGDYQQVWRNLMFRHLYRHTCENRICFKTCCEKMTLVPGWAFQIKSLSTPQTRNVHYATRNKLILIARQFHVAISIWGNGPRRRKIHKQVMKQGRKYPNNFHTLTKELFASRLDIRVFHNAATYYKIVFASSYNVNLFHERWMDRIRI